MMNKLQRDYLKEGKNKKKIDTNTQQMIQGYKNLICICVRIKVQITKSCCKEEGKIKESWFFKMFLMESKWRVLDYLLFICLCFFIANILKTKQFNISILAFNETFNSSIVWNGGRSKCKPLRPQPLYTLSF